MRGPSFPVPTQVWTVPFWSTCGGRCLRTWHWRRSERVVLFDPRCSPPSPKCGLGQLLEHIHGEVLVHLTLETQ